jgi:hypothetical protein
MSNNLLTISKITNEALMVLENETTFTAEVNREYDDQFAVTGAKIGNTVNVRRPGRFIGTTGPALNVEDFNETSVPVVLTTQFHVDTQFTTQDLALSLDAFSDRIIKPTMAAIGNKIDRDGLVMATQNTANTVGTAGTTPNALLTYLTAGAYLDSEAAPRDGKRAVIIEPFTGAAIVDSLKGLFVPDAKIGEQYRKGLMGRDSGGMNWKMDQNVVAQTYGAWTTTAGAITVNGANQGLATGWASSTTLNISATQNGVLNVGDTFTIAGVYGVNPQNRQSYGKLRSFVVKSAVTLSNGNTTVTVSPALIYGGQFQNVTISPANSAVITPFSIASTAAAAVTSPQNILFHKNAFTLACADLELPEGVHFAGRAADKGTGMSVRIVRQYTINNDSLPCRFDVLYGWAPLYQELACRIAG